MFSNCFYVLILGGHNLTSTLISGQHSNLFYVHTVEKQVHRRSKLCTSFTRRNYFCFTLAFRHTHFYHLKRHCRIMTHLRRVCLCITTVIDLLFKDFKGILCQPNIMYRSGLRSRFYVHHLLSVFSTHRIKLPYLFKIDCSSCIYVCTAKRRCF